MDIGMACARVGRGSYVSLTLFLLLSAVPFVSKGTPEFLNELHYDNISGDQNEGVEIAGPAGTNLQGWQVLLYNGQNGRVYKRHSLNGTIPDLGAGMGAFFFGITGIQNGSPDGVALTDDTNALLQFLSYEGSFMAVEDAAAGHTSIDVGINESSSAIIGTSLQLTGSGLEYEDFSWVAGLQSFGAFNTGQLFSNTSGIPEPGTLILIVSGLIGWMIFRWRGLPAYPALPNSSCCS